MKQLLISLLIILPFFTAQGLQIDDDDIDWKPMFTHIETPGHVNFSDEVSRALAAQAYENHNEPLEDLFKSAYGDKTDLDNCRFLSPLFNPAQASKLSDPDHNNDNDSDESCISDHETDNAWLLSKSRGGHKRTQYEQHERGQYEKKKELRSKKYTAQRKKNHKTAYAQLKADQLRDIKKQVLKPGEYSSFKNDFAPSDIDSSLTKSTKKPKNAVKQSENKTTTQITAASPYLFELFAQLENGLISPNVLRAELWDYDSDDTTSPYGLDSDYDSDSNSCADEDLHEWVDIVNNWDNPRRREYGVKNLMKSAFKCLRNGQHSGNSVLMGLWVMLDNLAQESDSSVSHSTSRPHSTSDDQPNLCANPMTRGEFLKAFRTAIAGTYRDDLDPDMLFDQLEAHRECLQLDTKYMTYRSDDYVPMNIAESLEKLSYHLSQATRTEVQAAVTEALYGRLRGSAFEKYLAAFAEKLGEIVQEEKADADEHDARYTNIPQEESDYDAAWELSKSRGARKRLGYRKHEKNKHATKKNMTRAQKANAHNEKSDKAQYAQGKSTEMLDTKKRVLKPSEYDTLKKETVPDDLVTELTQALGSLSLDSECAEAQSSSSNEEWEVCSDYQDCDNPECTYNMARICCKCAYGIKRRQLQDSGVALKDDKFDLAFEEWFEEWIAHATNQELRDYIDGTIDESHHSHASSSSRSESPHGRYDDDMPLRQTHAWRGNNTLRQNSDANRSKSLSTSRSNDDDDGDSSTSSSDTNDNNALRKQLEIQARIKHDENKRLLGSISEHSSDADQSKKPTQYRSNDDDDGDSSNSASNAHHDEPVPFPNTIFITPRQSDEQLRDARRIEIERMNRDFVALPSSDCIIV